MATEKNSVIVELYDLSITDREDDRFGRVVTAKSLTEDDLVDIAVERRTDLNATTLKAAMEILKEIATEQIANGASVNFGLGYFRLGVNGVFIGDNAKWDSSEHSLSVLVTPTADLRETIQETSVNVRGMAVSGLVINSITDVSTGDVNTTLTPGGGLNLTGSKIKILGDDESVGISLTHAQSETVTKIQSTAILVNDPSNISCIIPADLEQGVYTLTICTQYTGSGKTLKDPRSYTCEYELTVSAG